MKSVGDSPSRVTRFYGGLLHLFPRSYREQHADELRAFFHNRYAEERTRGRVRAATYLVRAAWDVITQATAERWVTVRTTGLNGVGKDGTLALRDMRRNPGLAVVVMLTVALGIAASTVIFTVVDAVLIRPLPFGDPERLVWIETFRPDNGGRMSSNLADFADWRTRSTLFAGMAAYTEDTYTVSTGGEEEAQRTLMASVSPEYFDVLQTPPLYGRTFVPHEMEFGRHRVVILRHDFWSSRLGGDPGAIGRTIRVNGTPMEIVGVMPPRWPGAWSSVQVWRPMSFPPGDWRIVDRGSRSMQGAVGRIRPGASVQQADAELRAVSAGLENEYRETNDNLGARAMPIRDRFTERSRTPLRALLGAVGCLVLIGCANVASMLLARGATRERDVAVRRALGASGTRILRMYLIESLTLGLAGGVIGMVLTRWLLSPAASLAGDRILGLATPSLDLRVLGFAALLSVTTAVLFGLAPALYAARSHPGDALKDTRAAASRRQTHRLLRGLLGFEVAMAVVLLMGAGLMLEAFRRQNTIYPGYDPDGVLSFEVSILPRAYPDGPAMLAYWDALIERLTAIPEVEAVGTTMFDMPLIGGSWITFFGVHGRPLPAQRNEWENARFALVGGDYLTALGVPLIRGRALNVDDNRAGAPRVVVVNETLVRHFFPGEDPLGRRVWLFGPGDMDATIVGVVGDVRMAEFTAPPERIVYVPTAQTTHGFPGTQWVFLRTRGDAARLATGARAAVLAQDRNSAIARMAPLQQVVHDAFAPQRFNTIILGVFAVAALLLAGVGLYGVVAYIVSRQRRDIGIRMALGAQRPHAVGLVLRQIVGTVVLGLAAGLIVATALARVLAARLFGVPPSYAGAILAVTSILLAVAVLACLVPARKAASVAPVEAMRSA